MAKCPVHIDLQRNSPRPRRRSAFTLAELVVSLGVLVLLFSLAGQVFSITVKSTGQARALTNVSQLLRSFEQTLREDLRHVHAGQSFLLIQGNPVNAYWTKEGQEADDNGDPSDGYPHNSDPRREDADGNLIRPRADMLMFFTARSGTSFTNPDLSANIQQVVYAHAVLGEYVLVDTGGVQNLEFVPRGLTAYPEDPSVPGFPSAIVVSQVPADQWHLARRGVLLFPSATPPLTGVDILDNPSEILNILNDPRLLRGERDVVGQFNYEAMVLTAPEDPDRFPEPHYLPYIFPLKFGPDNILEPIRRSLLDPSPPAQRAGAVGQFMLPGCASFKVEWALDPRSKFVDGRLDTTRELIWIDPGSSPGIYGDDANSNPLSSLIVAADDCSTPQEMAFCELLEPKVHPDGKTYSLADRFLGPEFPDLVDPKTLWPQVSGDGRPHLAFFNATRLKPDLNDPINNSGELVPDDIFPIALRITVDVYDEQRRLDRPIRHVMVVPVGGV